MIFNGSNRSIKRFNTIESDFNRIYNFKYDYSESIYNAFKEPIHVKCKEHGYFSVTPKRHIEGQTCQLCSEIINNGHVSISKNNLKTHREFLIQYLSQKYPLFNFDNFEINKGYHFECKEHGYIFNTKIVCSKCNLKIKNNKKLNTTKALLKNRTEEVLHLEYNNVVLKCDHGTNTYTNSQLRGDVILCKECSNTSFNKISQDEFIKRCLTRIGDKHNITKTTYVDAKTKIKLSCEKHGDFYLLPSNFLKGQGCNLCTHRTSKAEDEIANIIPNSKRNDRDAIHLELDILHNDFAIEYDGLMYHSEGKSKYTKFNKVGLSKIHITKTELCEEKGIQLFHIFENEWLTQKEKWTSVIKTKLNLNTKVFARKCSIKEIDNNTYKEFCENNHLQGYGIASIRLGLHYNNELISVMSFAKSRYNKSIEYELIRFCSKLNTTVVGGASKLLKYFETRYKPSSIISYANRRWSQGNLYEKLGFTFSHNTIPNYFYFKVNDNVLYSREKFQKHKLEKLLPLFDSSLTETENMFNNGYRKIYDCGNKVYIKMYK